MKYKKTLTIAVVLVVLLILGFIPLFPHVSLFAGSVRLSFWEYWRCYHTNIVCD